MRRIGRWPRHWRYALLAVVMCAVIAASQTALWLINGGHWWAGIDQAATAAVTALLSVGIGRRLMVSGDDHGQK